MIISFTGRWTINMITYILIRLLACFVFQRAFPKNSSSWVSNGSEVNCFSFFIIHSYIYIYLLVYLCANFFGNYVKFCEDTWNFSGRAHKKVAVVVASVEKNLWTRCWHVGELFCVLFLIVHLSYLVVFVPCVFINT